MPAPAATNERPQSAEPLRPAVRAAERLAAGLYAVGRLSFQTAALRWVVGLFCGLTGSLMLVAPEQFSSSGYVLLQLHLAWWGSALILAGFGLFSVAAMYPNARYRLLCHVLAGTLLLLLAGVEAWGGELPAAGFQAVLGIGVLVGGPRLKIRGIRSPRHRDLLHMAVGLAMVAAGLGLFVPSEVLNPAGNAGSLQWSWGQAGLLISAGLALAAVQRSARPRAALLLVTRLVAGVALMAFAAESAVLQHTWGSLLLYGTFGAALMVAPFMQREVPRRNAPSLRARLTFVLCAATIVPLIAAFTVYARQGEAAVANNVLTLQERIAEETAKDLSVDITSAESAARTAARWPNLLELPAQEQAALLAQVALGGDFQLATHDAQGRGLARSTGRAPRDIGDVAEFTQVSSTGVPLSTAGYSTSSSDLVYRYYVPVESPGGGFAGVVVAEVRQIDAQIAKLDVAPGSRVYLVDSRGQVLAYKQNGLEAQGADGPGEADVSPLGQGTGELSPSGVHESAGQRWLAGHAQVPGAGWTVVAEQAEPFALADFKTVREIMFALLLAAAGLAVGAGYVVARQLSEPLGVLADAVHRLGSGESAAPLPETQVAELMVLAENFGTMRRRLLASTAELKETAERSEAILQSALDAVISLDESGRVIRWNRQAEVMFGWTAEEVLGADLAQLIVPSSRRGGYEANISELWRTAELRLPGRRIEAHGQRRNGEEFPMELSVSAAKVGESRTFTAFLRDISEVQKAEEVRAYLAAIVQSSDSAIVGNTLDGIITSWNAGAQRLYGYTASEIVGRPISDLAPRELKHEVRGILERVRRGERVERHDTVRLRKDGTSFDAGLTISPIRDDSGQIIGAAALSRDITALKQDQEERARLYLEARAAEKRLRDLNEELEQRVLERTAEMEKANRDLAHANRQKSQFLANMSHELRTPLNAIIGFSEVLLDPVLNQMPDEQRLHFISNIQRSGRHLLGLINDILDLSKVEAGRMELHLERLAVAEVIQSSIDIVRPMASKKGIVIRTHCEPAEATIVADPARLKQILYNLLSNAVKFTSEGGSVDVSAMVSTDEARLAVRDTGVGVKPENHRLIFEEFRQADEGLNRQEEGTGLGLALVRKLTELHGGTVELESELGRGSCFTVTLPTSALLAAPQRAESSSGMLTGEGPRPGAPAVVVIEDQREASELLSLHLTQAGYAVHRVSDADQALDVVTRLQPFAVTLDLLMPGRDGWDLLQTLKSDAATRDIPVVVVSVVDEAKRGLDMGAAEYLVKPIDGAALVASLDRIRAAAAGHSNGASA